MFNQRTNSSSPPRISQNGGVSASFGKVPSSNYFGGTFQKSAGNSPIAMVTKENIQKMRVVRGNQRVGFASPPPVDQSALLGLSRTSGNFNPRDSQNFTEMQKKSPTTAIERRNSIAHKNQGQGQSFTVTGARRVSLINLKQQADPFPPKFTNDTAEFSMRQLALARMKVEKGIVVAPPASSQRARGR